MNKHTELPWLIEKELFNVYIKDSRYPTRIAFIFDGSDGGEDEANAEFIVKACNAHYELVEALKGARSYIVVNAFPGSDKLYLTVNEALKKAGVE